jgi:hypothetical protein
MRLCRIPSEDTGASGIDDASVMLLDNRIDASVMLLDNQSINLR